MYIYMYITHVHVYKPFVQCCTVYVGLAQARPNYAECLQCTFLWLLQLRLGLDSDFMTTCCMSPCGRL